MKLDLDKIYDKSSLKWLKSNTIYQTLHGSHAYGTSRPDSDIDLRGICMPPEKYPLGILDNFEQTVMAEPIDCTIFGIQKFCKLASEGNPNALEIIFTEPSDVQFINKIGESLLEIRDSFISKKCKFTLKGYAFSQLKRIRVHRNWIVRGDIKKPERSDFDLPDSHKLIPEHQQLEIEAQIKKVLEDWTIDTTGMEPASQIKFKEELSDIFIQLKLNHEDFDKYAARSLGLNDNLTEAFQKERAYKSALRDYKNWQTWKLERNKARFELEEKFGYDCYSDDTEFLTNSGFKKFDEITENDQLATINKNSFRVEYQKYTDKFDSLYNGPMYQLYGYHTDVYVTANHNMFFRKIERKSKKNVGGWNLNYISAIPDTFQILRQCSPNIKNYCVKDKFENLSINYIDYLKLMGWYLSDGCIGFSENKNGTYPNAINISQSDNKKMFKHMVNFKNKYKDNSSISLYKYWREPTETSFRDFAAYENILSIRDKNIVNKMFLDCSSGKLKRIPRYIFLLSKHMMNCLFDALMEGDGTESRPDNSMIYYSSMKDLANDVQELAFMCGYETSLYGPYQYERRNGYNTAIYQVHINKTRNQFKEMIRCNNI